METYTYVLQISDDYYGNGDDEEDKDDDYDNGDNDDDDDDDDDNDDDDDDVDDAWFFPGCSGARWWRCWVSSSTFSCWWRGTLERHSTTPS